MHMTSCKRPASTRKWNCCVRWRGSMEREYAVLYAAAFLDLCSVSMITIHLPHYLRQLGASHTTVGYIGSLYGFVQLFSSPVMGGYADTHNKRSLLVICMTLCSIGYLLLGCSTSLLFIAFLRIYLGVFKHPQNLLKSALSDLTSSRSIELSSQAQGYFESARSVAFIVSPPIAGYLMQGEGGYASIGLCVAVMFAGNAVLVWSFLPSDSKTKGGVKSSDSKQSGDKQSHRSTWAFLSMSDVDGMALSLVFAGNFLLAFAALLWRNTYGLLYKELYHLSHTQIGWLISLNASGQTLTGCLMRYVSMAIPNSFHQLLISCFLYMVAFVCVANTSHAEHLYVIVPMMSAASMVSRVSYHSFVNTVIGRKHIAYLIGVSGSLNALARLSSPIIVGWLMEHFSKSTALYCSAISVLCAVAAFSAVHLRETMYKRKTD